MDALVKVSVQSIPVPVIGTVRYLMQTVAILIFVRLSRGTLRSLRTGSPRLQVVRGLLLFGSTVTFWIALRTVPLAEAVALSSLSPVIATALAIPVLGERPRRRQWGAVVLGAAGALLVVQPGTAAFAPTSLLPLGTAVFYAGFQVVTRRLGPDEAALSTLFFTGLIGLGGMAGGLALGSGGLVPAMLVPLLLISVCGLLAHLFLIRALQLAPVPSVAPLSYTGLVWSTAYGFIFFGQLPNTVAVVGMTVITAGGLLLIQRAPRKAGDPLTEAEVVPWT